jgi:two-component system cell cycle sensor histidine kinase/response regulator CckA
MTRRTDSPAPVKGVPGDKPDPGAGDRLAELARENAALREGRDRFRALVEATTDWIWEVDADCRYTYASPQVEALLGYSPDEVVGRTPFDLMPPDEAERVRAEFVAVRIQGGAFHGLRNVNLHKDGRRVVLETGGTPILAADGSPLGCRGIDRDITARVQAEQALRESRATLRSIFRAAPTGIGLISNRVMLDLNDRFCEITGYSREELLGQNARMLYLTQEDYERVGREKYKQIAEQGTGTIETRWRRKDGRVINVLLSSTPLDPADLAAGVTFTALDTTERSRVEAALRQSEERFRSIVQASPMGILMYELEPDGRLVLIDSNRAADEMTGADVRMFIGKTLEEAFPALVGTEVPEMYRRAARDGIPWQTQDLTYQDEVITGAYDVYAFQASPGRTAVLFLDVTDRTRAEQDRRRLEGQLRHAQKMEAVGQLAGGVAHDFNNLLQAIAGYTELSLAELAADSSIRGNLHEVSKAAERAAVLTRQLLTFSRRETLQPAHLDLNDVIADLMKMLGRIIGEHIELTVTPGHELRNVHADRGQVEQILMNLCVNARDAMPDGGRISIETRNEHLGPEYCQAHPSAGEGDYVLLAVSDTGEGIAPEIQERVFEPFFTTKEVGQGTGLGLATVYAIVARHGGLIDLDSGPGRGTTFRVYLPASPAAAEAEAPAAVETVEGGDETILLAEDDEAVRKLAVRILSRGGYRVLVARDGAGAMDLLDRHAGQIDLAILDVVMPKRSGHQIHDEIRRRGLDVPVLFSSGYSYAAIDGDQIPEGAQLIQKPYGPEELLRATRSILLTGKA